MGKHLAEMLLELKLHGRPDPLRKHHPFSEDMESQHAVLFNRAFNRFRKIKSYRRWLETGQPCVFGRIAAKNENVFIHLPWWTTLLLPKPTRRARAVRRCR